jgi:plastocyanin
MSIRVKMTFTVFLLTAATACGSYRSPTSPTPTTVSATIVSGGFMPNPITISAGSTVMWTNSDSIAHAIVTDSAELNSGTIAPGATFSHAFPSAGTVAYHDAANPSVVGTVNVTVSSSPSPY